MTILEGAECEIAQPDSAETDSVERRRVECQAGAGRSGVRHAQSATSQPVSVTHERLGEDDAEECRGAEAGSARGSKIGTTRLVDAGDQKRPSRQSRRKVRPGIAEPPRRVGLLQRHHERPYYPMATSRAFGRASRLGDNFKVWSDAFTRPLDRARGLAHHDRVHDRADVAAARGTHSIITYRRYSGHPRDEVWLQAGARATTTQVADEILAALFRKVA